MRCPKCGNESNGKFCGICGAKLEDSTAQSNDNGVYEFNFNVNQSQQQQLNSNQQSGSMNQQQFDANNIAFTSGEHFEGKGFNINDRINKINQNTTQLNSEDIKFTSGNFVNQNSNVNNGAPIFGNQNSNVNGVPTFGNQNSNVNNGAPIFGNQNSNVNGAPTFGNQNNYNNNVNMQNNNVTPNSITKRINKNNLKKPAFLLGTIGSIVLLISVFLTYVSVSMTMFGYTESQGVKLIDCEDGKFFLVLAIVSLIFSVLYLGIPTLVVAGIQLILGIYEIANSSKLLGIGFSDYLDVKFGPGAILLIIGSVAVLAGGIMMYRDTKKKFAFNINNIGQQFADTMKDRANNLGNDYTNSFGNTSWNGMYNNNVQNNNMQNNSMNVSNNNVPNSNMPVQNGSMPNNNMNMLNSNVNMPVQNSEFDIDHSVNLNKDNDSQIPPQ